MEGLKSHHGVRDFLDETMILFDHIVQIFNLTDFYKTDQSCQHQQHIDILNAGIVGAAIKALKEGTRSRDQDTPDQVFEQ